MLERGRAHPILGPILLIALVVLLAFVFLHLAEEGTAAEIGAMCLALVTVLWLPLLERPRSTPTEPLVSAASDRGPPSVREGRKPRLARAAIHSRSLPLRR
jgi:hypothetical protein